MNAGTALAREGGVLITMHSLSQGGGDRIAVTLAAGFAAAGIPSRILLMASGGEGEDALAPLLPTSVSVIACGAPLKGPVARVRERLRGVGFIRKQIAAFEPAVVLGATDNMALVTALARGPRSRRPLLVQKLTNRVFRPNLGPLRRVYRKNLFGFIFGRVDLVVTLTEGERRNLLADYPALEGRTLTLSNPHLSDDMFAGGRSRPGGPPRLLTAGRMVPQKRYDLLIDALALSRHSDARLVIFGDGPLRASLQKRAEALGIADRVEMPGFIGDIMPEIRKSDLVVLSSDYEGLPGVLIRALASNVPVVTTDSFFAARELLGDAPSCTVVRTGDAAELALAIDQSLERGLTGDLRQIVEPYRTGPAVDAYIEAFDRLLERHRGS